MKFDEMSLRKRQMMVGMAKQLYDEGLTTKEVAAKMGISESTVRSLKNTIDQARANGMK
jgi:DNA-binding transcriptional regulator LsrR (DeoR family)